MAESTLERQKRLAAEPYEPEGHFEPTADERKLASKIEGLYKEKDQWKEQFERQWYVNHAAIFGNHWVQWNSRLGLFQTPAGNTPNQAKVQVPFMLAYYRRTLSRLTAHRPGWFVQPMTPDQDDVERAERDLQVIESEYKRLGAEKKIRDFVGWMLEGNAFMAFRWNPFAGRDLKGQDGQPVMDQFGRKVRQGETEMEVVSPFEILIDPQATDLQDDALWLIRSSIRTTAWIRQNYPERGQYVKGEDVWINDIYKARHHNVVGIQGQWDSTRKDKVSDAAVVHEYWERPSPEHPKGRLVVVARGIILFQGPNPYQRMVRDGLWCPFVHSGEVKVTGRLWYMAMVEQNFPLNRLLNRALTQEEMNRGIFGGGKWLRPSQCSIIEGSFDGGPGEEIVYDSTNPGLKPEQVTYQSTSAATETVINRALQFLQEGLALHEPSRGIQPSKETSGIAIDHLQKADDTSIGATDGNVRDAVGTMGRMILCINSEFWTEERMTRATGEDGKTKVRGIRGKDMDSDDDAFTFDVSVTPHSMSWRDPDEQRKRVDYLISKGFLNPQDPSQRSEALKILDQADTGDIYKDDKLDTNYACEENDMMASGYGTIPMEFENHRIHMAEHDRFRKTEKYRNLSPEMKRLVDDHVLAHERWIVEIAKKKAMMEREVQMVLTPPPMPGMAGPVPPGGPPPEELPPPGVPRPPPPEVTGGGGA